MASALPDKVIPFVSPDKLTDECWDAKRNLANFPTPYRMIICGPVGSGKTAMIKNILLRAQPCFEAIYCRHNDPEYSELKELGAAILEKLPDPSEIADGEHKIALIIDDFKIDNWDRDEKDNLARLLQYGSSHKNISVMLCSQRLFNVPVALRACMNLFIVYKSPNLADMDAIAPRVGMTVDEFRELWKKNLESRFDSVCIDLTAGTPAPFRKNLYEVVGADPPRSRPSGPQSTRRKVKVKAAPGQTLNS